MAMGMEMDKRHKGIIANSKLAIIGGNEEVNRLFGGGG